MFLMQLTHWNCSQASNDAVVSKGNGENSYSITDAADLQETAYYRIKQTDCDAQSGYIGINKLSNKIN